MSKLALDDGQQGGPCTIPPTLDWVPVRHALGMNTNWFARGSPLTAPLPAFSACLGMSLLSPRGCDVGRGLIEREPNSSGDLPRKASNE